MKILNHIKNYLYLYCEVSLKETYEGVKQYKELKDFLQSYGFSIQIEAIPDNWDMGNVLFVKK